MSDDMAALAEVIIKKVAISKLEDLAKHPDTEVAHSEADEILLELIHDPEVRAAYEKIKRWYA